jgi:hypothetical protein
VSENTRIALISASAAILGALAGGLTTYLTTQQAEKSQDRRDERRLDDQARGVARRMLLEFREAEVFFQTLKELDARPPRGLARLGRDLFPLGASAEELGLLYSRLSWREWVAVADGLLVSDLIGVLLRKEVPLRGGKEAAAKRIETFTDARDALRRVARSP